MRRLLLSLAAVLALAAAPPAGAATISVSITRTGFVPASATINFGDTVTWTNIDTGSHQVVATNGLFASPTLARGQRYSFTFKNAGRFAYRDAFRAASRGTITVREAPSTLTLGASQPIVVAGGAVTLTGVVSSGRAGETVTIYHLPYGQTSLIQLAVVLTGTGGGFSYTASPAILTSYEARWRTAISAQVAIQVKPRISLMPQGRRFRVNVFAPVSTFAGHWVYLQRRSVLGQWVSVRKLVLGPRSGRIFAIARRERAFTYRIFMTVNQAGPGYLDSVSGTQRLKRRG
jgi:plastocyanin